MRRAIFFLILPFLFAVPAFGQFTNTLLKQIREIKLLESTQDDVHRALLGYEMGEYHYDYQRFSNTGIDITVEYSSGECTDDPEEDADASDVWKVGAGRAVRIEVEFDDAVTFSDLGVDPTKFKKEQKYARDTEEYVYFDKSAGLAFYADNDGVEKVLLFPPNSMAKKLCEKSNIEKEFYEAKTWFTKSRPSDRTYGDESGPANVNELTLSTTEVSATLGLIVDVTTDASDPENDVLTYKYSVTAGRIVGSGAKVTWDLTGVAPGNYTITAGVDDGCGLCGKTVTKTITVK